MDGEVNSIHVFIIIILKSVSARKHSKKDNLPLLMFSKRKSPQSLPRNDCICFGSI